MTGLAATVVALGDLNLDVLMAVADLPAKGKEAFAKRVELRPGGSAASAAAHLARLGVQTRLLACCGNDVFAESILPGLAASGVDLRAVQRTAESATGLSFVAVSADGERTMFTTRGANTRLHPDHINPAYLSDAAMLHLSGYALLESPQRDALQRAVALAQAGGIPISLDTALDPALRCPDDMRRLLPGLTICALGLEEASVLLGSDDPDEAIERLLALRVKIAAIKLAGKGCLLAAGAEKVQIPPFIVPSVDATGAGDAFCAGLIYGWLNGLSLSATGVLAGALGALATTAFGGGGSLHDIATLTTFLAYQRASSTYSAYLAAFDELIQTLQKARQRA